MFAAIRFVLCDAYTKLTAEERQSLLHEGTQASMSAFVEIVFDNSDNRFPTGNDRVHLRRTVGLKKDEFSIDKKSFSKSEVLNLLTSAGFSKSNPYYIVPQGRITALTTAKDTDRLELLKQVAGTKVYEDNRVESLKIIEETELKREKINTLLESIDERLEELEQDKEELKQYHELDREKKCCEYSIFNQEQNEANIGLQELDEEFKQEHDKYADAAVILKQNEEEISNIDAQIRNCKQELRLASDEKSQLENVLVEELALKTKYELLLKEYETSNSSKDQRKLAKENDQISKQIVKKEKELEKVSPKLLELVEQQRELENNLNMLQNIRNSLVSKKGRASEFNNSRERDIWIEREISQLQGAMKSQKKSIGEVVSEIQEIEPKIEDLREKVSQSEQIEKQRRSEILEANSELQKVKSERDSIAENRKEAWREESRLENAAKIMKDEVVKCMRNLSGVMDKNTALGLEAVKKITERLKLKGVYGPLYELFEVEDLYKTAVEVVAGNSLFNVVVDTDETASILLNEMIKEKSGRVTFIPLNRISPKSVQFPNQEQAIPLMSKLKFDKNLKLAFEQIFGRAVVVPDLSVGSSISRNFKLDCITLDGDRTDKKGSLSGGYIDSHRSKLKFVNAWRSWNEKHQMAQRRLIELKKKIMILDQSSTLVSGKMQQLEAHLRRLGVQQSSNMKNDLSTLEQILEAKIEIKSRLEAKLAEQEQRVESLTVELGTPLRSKLSSDEQKRLDQVYVEIEETKTSLIENRKETSKLQILRNEIVDELELVLKKRKMEISNSLEDSNESVELQSKLSTASKNYETLLKRSSELEEIMDRCSAESVKLHNQLETLKTKHNDTSQSVDSHHLESTKYLSKKSLLQQKRDEALRKIRDLGVLPEHFEKYKDLPIPTLLTKLKGIAKKLAPFKHVNRRAIEQFQTFSKQQSDLNTRKAELDASCKSINEFIQSLDRQKDEAIQRTFEQVADNFESIFSSLVPKGHGSLLLDKDDDMNFIGVGIQTSFSSKKTLMSMNQLSGGQKSLVALALIFAIQRCDPAPFYLFDEIDANLDQAHRQSVANLIASESKNAQFITTTFRPELLLNADKFYGVSFSQKVSSVQVIARDDALGFVQQETQ